MCLIATHFFPKISFKPIKVYKIVLEDENGELTTPFMHSKLLKRAKGVFFFPKIIDRRLHRLHIEKGMIHAFTTKRKAISIACDYVILNNRNNLNIKVITAYIPSFTRYYLGKYWDICAKRMRYETI